MEHNEERARVYFNGRRYNVPSSMTILKAMEYAGLSGRETVLDAYCGTGTIGLIASDQAKRVIGVELNRDAVRDAVVNARKNGVKNIQFYQKDAGEFMVQLAGSGHLKKLLLESFSSISFKACSLSSFCFCATPTIGNPA